MARVCEFCKKGPISGNKVSHSNTKAKTRWLPNLKRMKTVLNGTIQTVRVCTRCIRNSLVVRPVKRAWSTSN